MIKILVGFSKSLLKLVRKIKTFVCHAKTYTGLTLFKSVNDPSECKKGINRFNK